jgi:hypothetical protein
VSHHLDSELSRRDNRLDLTDHYVFRGETGTVFVMDVNSSLATDAPPGWHPEARYEFKIHTTGGELEDLTYRLSFGPRDAGGGQSVALRVLTGSQARDDTAEGELLAEGRTGTVITGPAGLRLWTGRAADPFYVDLTQVVAVNAALKRGAKIELPGWRPEIAQSSFTGSFIHSIVLEIADDDPRLGVDQNIGVWSATKLATDAGGWRQINREGHPMIWPIFRPDDGEAASTTNETHPVSELPSESEHIAKLVAAVVRANGTADDPEAHGRAVARRLLPDVLPYRTGTPAEFGFADVNGRGLADNAPEVMFSLVLNSAVSTGLTSEQFANTRSATFPYVVAAPAE